MTDTTFPRPANLAHVVLRTSKFDEVIEWWSTVLGAHVVHQNDFLAFLTYDDEHHRLAVLRSPDLGDTPKTQPGLEHIAFTYASLDDLVATYERLRDAGITPALPINHGMTLSMYYADPDGSQAELQIDLCSADEANAFMKSEHFASNPVGVVFDPEELAKQHRAGRRPDALDVWGPTATA